MLLLQGNRNWRARPRPDNSARASVPCRLQEKGACAASKCGTPAGLRDRSLCACPRPAPTPASVEVADSHFLRFFVPLRQLVDIEGYAALLATDRRCWSTLIGSLIYDGGRWVYTDCGWYVECRITPGAGPISLWPLVPARADGLVLGAGTASGARRGSPGDIPQGYCGWRLCRRALRYRPGLGLTFWSRNVWNELRFRADRQFV